jgi:hypothetical protein
MGCSGFGNFETRAIALLRRRFDLPARVAVRAFKNVTEKRRKSQIFGLFASDADLLSQ